MVVVPMMTMIPSYSRKHLSSRLSWNRDMAYSSNLQFSNGISYFLCAILLFIPCSSTISSSRRNAIEKAQSLPPTSLLLEYDEFQIIMEAEGTPQTRQEGILHGPLTAVNAPLRFDEGTKGETQRKSKESTRKLVGFPLETSVPPFPPSSSSIAIVTSNISTMESLPPNSPSAFTRSAPSPTQYSIQVLRSRPSRRRTRRSTNAAAYDAGPERKEKGRVAVNEMEPQAIDPQHQRSRSANKVAHHHIQSEKHPHHHHHYPNSLYKRAATISPPQLFLKIFMDYSSLSEDEKSGGINEAHKGDGAVSQSGNHTIKRLRPHRSFRTSGVEVVAEHLNNISHGVNANNGTGPHQVVLKPHKKSTNSSLSSSSNDTISEDNDTRSFLNGTHNHHLRNKCIPAWSSCPDGFFACKSNSALCVPQSSVCNGRDDCPDASDEDKDCENVHEKKFWDNFYKKRPAADLDDEDAKGNGTCRYIYNASKNADEDLLVGGERSKLGKEEHKVNQFSFPELLEKELCRCSQEKVFCHNVHLPNLHAFPKDIQFLDLTGSVIDGMLEFPNNRFQRLETLVLSSCGIREISVDMFASLPKLKVLYLQGNHLRRIPPLTFSGNGNLVRLYLDHNHLQALDSESFHGLHSLEYLDLRKNRLTGEDFNVFHTLVSLKTLILSYNEIHRIPSNFLFGLSTLDMLSFSKNKISSISGGAFNHTPRLKHLHLSYNRLSVLENNVFCNLQNLHNLNLNDNGITRIEPQAFDCLCSLQSLILQKNPFRELTEDDGDIDNPRQLFGNLINLQHIEFEEWWMCWWAPHVRSCKPKGDGISSVDNLLDNIILRICVWIVGLVGVGGNFFVIISRLMIREKNRAHSFYIKNLAVADLLMGLFLISIAFHDLAFRGHFIAHQHSWRHSITCQLSGMLSTLSSEASVFILFLITLDRYLSIVRPFAERTNALIPAVLICALLWAISIFLSYAPLCPWFRDYFGKSFYTSNGLCLPLHIHNPFETGWEYSLFLFIVINSVAFIFICYAYWKMLRIIQMSTTSIRSTQQKQDGMLVKRFGLVVFTDFLCWAPIIIIKCVAMAGVQVQSDLYAWLAVFVLPVNSALNPIIYTLSTKLFKQQVKAPVINRKLLINVSHFTIGFRKRLGLANDDSSASSFLYRNRISRTLQTSMNSSMMLSTRRHGGGGFAGGDSNNSTRATVLRDRMPISNRMSSKVGSYSPPAPIATTGNTAPVVVSGPLSTSPSSIREHASSKNGTNNNCDRKNTLTRGTTAVAAEINGQIAQQHEQQQPQFQQKVDGCDKNAEVTVIESQL